MSMPHGEQAPPTGVFGAKTTSNGAAPTPLAPADVLGAARVDLVAYLRDGIPPREYVPGSRGLIVKGKRLHIAAERKTGKSLAFGIVHAVNIVEAGGTVAVLDRENGADEYARRLDAVLKGRGSSPELVAAVQERFRYYAWPTMNLKWSQHPGYPEAFADVDLTIFDSSRKFLTSVGLKEDLSDDFSTFTEALIDPLSRHDIATAILDNTGHDAKDRARGSSAKGDLADITFTLKTAAEFNEQQAGRLELVCKESRFGDVHGTWTMDLGAGAFGYWERPQEDGREAFRETVLEALAKEAPMGRDRLLAAVRKLGIAGTEDTLRGWLADLASDPTSGVTKTSQGYVPEGWTESAVHPSSTPWTGTPGRPPRRDGVSGVDGPLDDDVENWQPYRAPVEDEDDERKDLA